ncbi:MAG: hypothetical protein ACRDPO_37445, partial [Streptosporangiaceae bacterium]
PASAPAAEPASQPAAAAPAANPAILTAVGLGWDMAELYASVRPRDLHPPPVPPHPWRAPGWRAPPDRIQLQADLPGLGKLQDRQHFALLADQVTVAVHQLAGRITDAGLTVPEHDDWLALAGRRGDPETDYRLARSVLLFHDDLLAALTAADHQTGLAYGLGRAVADLTLRMSPGLVRTRAQPAAGHADAAHAGAAPVDKAPVDKAPVDKAALDKAALDKAPLDKAPLDKAAAAKATADARMKALTDDLRDGRVDAISGWLKELHTALPPHVAGAMIGSIRQWQLWAASPMWQGAPLDWQAHGREVEHALTVQGQRWRLLLTGQVNPLDQMSPDDYVQAAGFFVGRVRQILQRLIAQYWPWVAVATLVMVIAVAGSLVLLHSSAAKGIGVAVSVFGWLGITGGSLSGALTRTVSHVESSLWQAELDLAAAWANTTLPDADADRQLREAPPPKVSLSRRASPPAPSTARPARPPAPRPPAP